MRHASQARGVPAIEGDGSAASIEGLRPYAYRCAIRLSLHKYKGKAAAEAYF